ncbi:hypothetical protein BGZ76_008700 [Entomortierella beljakovae]|nr:hypothetical protein BGZ76_008700 [Entomortierella beljakovae]
MTTEQTKETKGQPSGTDIKVDYRLNTISFSHYNEKARWALDYYKIPYVEYRSLPVLHGFTMFKYRVKGTLRVPDAITPLTTPVLVIPPARDGTKKKGKQVIVRDSTGILNFLSDKHSSSVAGAPAGASPNLYSDDEATREKILELEERFDNILGKNVRLWVYYEILLKCPNSVGRSLGHDNAGKLQTKAWSAFFPIFSFFLSKLLKITETSAAESKESLKQEFDHISRLLESAPAGQTHLVGNQFTAADLTLATLAGPLVGITHNDGYGAKIPMDQLRPEALEFMNELRETRAGKHIVECWKNHRGEKPPGSSYGYNFFGLW